MCISALLLAILPPRLLLSPFVGEVCITQLERNRSRGQLGTGNHASPYWDHTVFQLVEMPVATIAMSSFNFMEGTFPSPFNQFLLCIQIWPLLRGFQGSNNNIAVSSFSKLPSEDIIAKFSQAVDW